MYDFEQLNSKTKDQLKAIAMEKNIPRLSTMKKLDIINAILEAERTVVPEKAVVPKEITEKQSENRTNTKPKKRERPSDVTEMTGVLDVKPEGYGFLRFENYASSKQDIFVAPQQIKRFNLKTGDEITGDCRLIDDEDKSSPLLFVKRINGDPLEIALKRRPFEKLIPVFPIERITLETDKSTYSTRLIDIISPIGKGQRGMIVAPPKAGKTTIIKDIAKAIRTNNPDIKLIILLIDERPEEVTDIKKSIDCDVIYSTFDQMPENHCRLSEMVLERAQRLVEQNKDVVVLLDSITRLVRAYNLTEQPSGRTLSGGLEPNALYKPKKFFGAARKIENGGSLTIIATALVETGSRMDDVIFEEFKGTGNMELKLDRSMQERRIYPAIDVPKSGTRREENLLSDDEQKAGWTLRRELSKEQNITQYVKVLQLMKVTKNNNELVNFINKQGL
ncbi:MAG: transcription termination factor Rho [Oscillospiraceae bacterium]|nr:transcription termination factor Rho [Oscillospiraceae bacterium]